MPEWTRTPPSVPGLYVARPVKHDVIILPGQVGQPPMTNDEPQTFYVAYLKVDPKAGLHAFLPLVSIPVADLPVEWWGPMDDPARYRWSPTPPSTPGFYWLKMFDGTRVMEVRFEGKNLMAAGEECYLFELEKEGREWAGPIEAPV